MSDSCEWCLVVSKLYLYGVSVENHSTHEFVLGMEDGDISEMEVSAPINAADTGELLNKMANYPDVEVTVIKNKNITEPSPTKVNGESEKIHSEEPEEDTSDEEVLIIDEDCKKVEFNSPVNHKRLRSPSPRANFKGFKKRIIEKSQYYLKITNEIRKTYHLDDKDDKFEKHIEEPFVKGELITKDSITQNLRNDSDIRNGIGEIHTLIDQKPKKPVNEATSHTEPLKHKHATVLNVKASAKRSIKKRPSQKLAEYAQYLGLQPTVKFKCVKCSESSFPSLSALSEHQQRCVVQPASTKTTPAPVAPVRTATSTHFRITRRVFLCSVCGTYYENYKLFRHMREVHRRYTCLYCFRTYLLPEKLSLHLVSKHNCSPNHYSSAEEFLNSYTESCFLVCCHCERSFSERDNFFDHVCLKKRTPLTVNSCWSCGVRGSAAHLATCKADEEPAPNLNSQKPNAKSLHPKTQKQKATKAQIKAAAQVQHVTADSPSTVVVATDVDNEEENKAGDHFMAAIASHVTTEPEVTPPTMSDEPNPTTSSEEQNEIVTNNENHSADDAAKSDEEMTAPNLENEPEEPEIQKDTGEEKEHHSEEEDKEEMTPPEKQEDENSIVEQSDLKIAEGNEINFSQSDNDKSHNSDNDLDSSNNEEEENEKDTDNFSNENNQEESVVVPVETRKVPKVTLKLPPQGLIYLENESSDSEKLTMEVDENCDSDVEESLEHTKSFTTESEKPVNGIDNYKENSDAYQSDDESCPVAGDDVAIMELELDQPLDKFSIEDLLKTCLSSTIATCVYCNHARKIAVNGKQLGLHAIAEHRFAATVNSITAEELIPKNFVQRIKESLDEIETVYFNLGNPVKIESDYTEDGLSVTSFKRLYECFQCRYATAIHKELYLHNRKMHAKTILLCIMCKSNFYSYSELICHLCPGNYVLNSETSFRCCMCETNDLPSAFRLMVHLRKRHHTCDVCLEGCHNQSRLSNHVWKHKLHHLCYRCGIAYRNKPDITKHLFWKHGTESVLCKKCLQKKWPHVYHFCIPPTTFVCEECNLSFSRAVYLKVHKRLHSKEKPHACTEDNCTESFISKKLQLKHERRHREPVPIEVFKAEENSQERNHVKPENETNDEDTQKKEDVDSAAEDADKNPRTPEKLDAKQKNLIDVYDLPALNLSESDSDESEDEKPKPVVTAQSEEKLNLDEKPEDLPNVDSSVTENELPMEEDQKPVPILDGIWDNFKNYQATIEKNNLNTDLNSNTEDIELEKCDGPLNLEETNVPDLEVILADHDYCSPTTVHDTLEMEVEGETIIKNDETTGLDHDYCTITPAKNITTEPSGSTEPEQQPTPEPSDKKKGKIAKKKSSSSSESSSDSDSSSCTCGSNCSCSSSSGSSSSSSSSSESDSSSSEGKRRIQARRERRKERAKRKKESETSHATNTSAVDVVATEDPVQIPQIELPILESDLDTDETETDEDFYDEYPQRLANKILAEKRNQLALLAAGGPVTNGTILECSRPSTPSIPEETITPKKKVKNKKRKKKSRSSTPKHEVRPIIPEYLNHQSPLAVQSIPCTPIRPSIPSPLSITYPSIPSTPTIPPLKITPTIIPKSQLTSQTITTGSGSETDSNVRASKRRRVPNKFYGYSSDEEAAEKPVTPVLKWRKCDLPTPVSHTPNYPHPQVVPPITIKNIPSPAPVIEPVRAPVIHHSELPESDSDTEDVQHRKSSSDSSDDNRNEDSDSDTGQLHISQPPPPLPSASYPSGPGPGPHHGMGLMQGERSSENLYCYCQCPYDEVSEMIACDGKDCAIEWFHFECVGIMVPPKGKWFCPDCRKRNASRGEFLQI